MRNEYFILWLLFGFPAMAAFITVIYMALEKRRRDARRKRKRR